MGFNKFRKKIDGTISAILFTAIGMTVLLMGISFLTFTLSLSDADQVMVPNVVNCQLVDALIEMQAKQLFPRIQLRDSEDGTPAGFILAQDPPPGSIVKVGKRIDLTVSRGPAYTGNIPLEKLIGKNYDETKRLFAGTPIHITKPLYIRSTEPADCILVQSSTHSNNSTQKTQLHLVLSENPPPTAEPPTVNPANSLEPVYNAMRKKGVVFDFLPAKSTDKQISLQIKNQQEKAHELRILADLHLPQNNANKIYGIFTKTLPEYPYPMHISVDIISPEGKTSSLLSFWHSGGNFTVPYCLPEESQLLVRVRNHEIIREKIIAETIQ